MKKFVKRTTLFLFPVFCILVIFEITLENLPNNYSYKKKYLDKNSRRLKVLFLGNSHVYYGVNPQYIEQNSFNAAYVSQSVNCDYAILKKYEDRLDSLKYVLLPVDYFSLYNTIEYGSESFRVKNYFNYYGILLDGYFPNSLELFYGTVNNNIKRIWRVYHRNKLDIYSDRACNSLGWGDYGQPNRDLASTGKGAANRHKINNFQFFKSNLKYYDKFISWSRKNKVVLILYTPPAHKYYIDEFDKCTFEIIASIGKSLKNTNVFYYNFINDSSFLDNDFYDANHLNDRGAKKFSKIIDSIIKKSFQ